MKPVDVRGLGLHDYNDVRDINSYDSPCSHLRLPVEMVCLFPE